MLCEVYALRRSDVPVWPWSIDLHAIAIDMIHRGRIKSGVGIDRGLDEVLWVLDARTAPDMIIVNRQHLQARLRSGMSDPRELYIN